jgi:hypothetical protein
MTIRVLSLLLVAQLALVAYVYWPRESGPAVATALVEDLPAAAIQSLRISDGESVVALRRAGDAWLGEDDLPADADKVDLLLTALTATDPGYAIATSAGAALRFEVAEARFQRRIELTGAAGSEVVYLGTSPAFRKVHARRADAEAVHVIDLNSYDAPSAFASWLDRDLLALRDVTEISSDGFELRLDDGDWIATDGSSADPEAVASLLQAVAALRVTGLATEDEAALAEAGTTVLQLVATDAAGGATLTLIENDEQFFLRSSRYDALFGTSSYDAGRLRDAAGALR